GERLGDVERGDRAVELVLLADLARDGHLDRVDLLGLFLGRGAQLRAPGRDDGLLVLELPHVPGAGDDRQLLGQQVVAGVTVLHGDHVTGVAEVPNVLTQNDLHGVVPSWSGRAQPTTAW